MKTRSIISSVCSSLLCYIFLFSNSTNVLAHTRSEIQALPIQYITQNQFITEKKSSANTPAFEVVPSLFDYYAEIALLKKLLPDAVFHEEILPLVQTALKNTPTNHITPSDWKRIEQKILSLKESHGIDFSALYLRFLEKKTIKESVSGMLEQMEEDMHTLGKELGTQFDKFIEENKDLFRIKKEEETPQIHSL